MQQLHTSFNDFINENINESLTFDEIKDKFTENPYGIGAQAVEYVEGERGNPNRLVFRHDEKSRRDEIAKKLKAFGIPAKKMSTSTQDKAYKYRYELYLFENESPILENVYPDKNGQLSSYDKKTFTEVGRRTFYLGKDLAAIFLFGYSVHDWKGTSEYVVNVTCTTYSTDVKNLGNSSGSIIYSEAFGTENDALLAAHDYLKNFKSK
jgi:hypothetical protein